MHATLRLTVLCALLLTLVSFGQDATSPPAAPPTQSATPAPNTPAPAPPAAPLDNYTKAYQASGYGGGASRHQYVDKFEKMPIDPEHPIDAIPRNDGCIFKAGITLSDISPSVTINDFHVERRDIFRMMDQVMTPEGTTSKFMPLNFELDGTYNPSNPDQRAVFGRNTWLLWCAGNEDFWDWLAQHAYGILDFLHAIDSRKRGDRLARMGLFNQPGLKRTNQPGPWGLYIDTVEDKIGVEKEKDGRVIWDPFAGKATASYPDSPADLQYRSLKSDGVNPSVYGYPSGVIGLRLFPNPNFKGDAIKRWNAEAFYNDPVYAADPRTVRPFNVGMSCAICHVSAHPLNPPANPEEPKWSNLSSIIGAQYFRTSGSFGSRLTEGNFLWQYLASQQPGTIDTSMTATDQINNSNMMNPVFEMPARVERALLNPTEKQEKPAQTIEGIGGEQRRIARILMDGSDSIGIKAALARVYLNIGLFHDEWNLTGNTIIGFAPQKPFTLDVNRRNSIYWRVNENFRMGYLEDFFRWDKNTSKKPRTSSSEPRYQCSTQAMPLIDAFNVKAQHEAEAEVAEKKKANPNMAGEEEELALTLALKTATDKQKPLKDKHWNENDALRGSYIFTERCMICHSSKQPGNFAIEFSHTPPGGSKSWAEAPVDPDKLVLPFAWEDWERQVVKKGGQEEFRSNGFVDSPSYKNYVARASQLTGDDWPEVRAFLKDNYLSTDLRIPVTLTRTNAARAVGTNALDGQVWAEFSSLTYRNLPAVGDIPVYNPSNGKEDNYAPPGKGPGYYRVPSLVSVWTCAPLLNNNGLGKYIPDTELAHRVSVEGRLEMFDDAVTKLLTKSERGRSPSGEGGARGEHSTAWYFGSDPGWVYRTSMETELRIPAGHLRPLVIGVLPGVLPGWMARAAVKILDNPNVLPFFLVLLSLILAVWFHRAFLYLIVFTGLVIFAVLAITGLHHLLPWLVWFVPFLLLLGALAFLVTGPFTRRYDPVKVPENLPLPEEEKAYAREKKKKAARIAFWAARWGGVALYALVVLSLFPLLWAGHEFVNGNLGDLRVGPFPKGMPVNALMNMDPAKPVYKRLAAVRGLCAMLGRLYDENEKELESDEKMRRFKVKNPAAPESLGPQPYRFTDAQRLEVFNEKAGPGLLGASKCPDFVIDRGHYFGESLDDSQKRDLIAFLKTL